MTSIARRAQTRAAKRRHQAHDDAQARASSARGARRGACAPRQPTARAACADVAAAGRAQGTPRASPRAARAARARLGAPTDGAQRGGASGLPVRRRNAETHVQPHFGGMPIGGKTAVAQQRGRRPPQILAARGSPSHWRGRPRVGSSIAGEPFVQQKPNSAELRPVKPPHRPELRGIKRSHAKKGGEGGVCAPQVFCASKIPGFLARWQVRGPAALQGQ